MKSLPPILAAIPVVLLLLLGGYVGAYVGLCEHEYRWVKGGAVQDERLYLFKSSRILFAPAAWIDSMLRGHEVTIIP